MTNNGRILYTHCLSNGQEKKMSRAWDQVSGTPGDTETWKWCSVRFSDNFRNSNIRYAIWRSLNHAKLCLVLENWVLDLRHLLLLDDTQILRLGVTNFMP